jgi:hypothetical protein
MIWHFEQVPYIPMLKDSIFKMLKENADFFNHHARVLDAQDAIFLGTHAVMYVTKN